MRVECSVVTQFTSGIFLHTHLEACVSWLQSVYSSIRSAGMGGERGGRGGGLLSGSGGGSTDPCRGKVRRSDHPPYRTIQISLKAAPCSRSFWREKGSQGAWWGGMGWRKGVRERETKREEGRKRERYELGSEVKVSSLLLIISPKPRQAALIFQLQP